MPSFVVKPVQDSRERKLFLTLPWELYRGDPNWVPPLRRNQQELVGFKPHPFYENAEAQSFLALADGKPVGRILAVLNHAHNRHYNEKRGFFGFFESIDDASVAGGLFDAARAWLAKRGVTAIRGPAHPSMNYECGLLIDGFDSPPTFMMTYNKPYYQSLIESYGFQKAEDMFAFWGHTDQLATLEQKLFDITEEARKRFNVKTRGLNPRHFEQEVRLFLNVYNRSCIGTWGFTPLSDKEIQRMSATLKYLIVPEMTSIAEIDGEAVGAMFGLLDYNPQIAKIDGKLFPFGWLRLLWNRKAIKRVRLISTNVIPEYQKWGVGLVVVNRIIPNVLAWGIKDVEFSWVLESNRLSRQTLARGGSKIIKTYRMYDLELAP